MEAVSEIEFFEDQSSELLCVCWVYFYFKGVVTT